MRQAMTARLVAGLLLYSVIAVAQERSTLGEATRRTTVIVDEFQDLVSKSFGDVMAQCRSWMSLILANQSTSQLENRDLSLADFVFENTTVKQYFSSVGKRDVELLQSLSKDKIKSLGGASVQGLSTSVSFRDTVTTELERDDILDVTATFGRSFVVLNDGTGHREPDVIQQTHTYTDLSTTPMPRKVSPVKVNETHTISVSAPRPRANSSETQMLCQRIDSRSPRSNWRSVGQSWGSLTIQAERHDRNDA